ncbi:MAG TPA: hypothetical protein VFK58_07645 [Sphingomicrobium sp.]|nr:hypothetical protein [Sphingomicrobium sp.]
MNPFEMVVIIVAIVMIASVIKARHGHGRRGGTGDAEPRERLENQRLREEVSELKERIKVLERITVDKENSLARQIEELRDR